MKKRRFFVGLSLIALVIVSFGCGSFLAKKSDSDAKEMLIVENGKSLAPIIISKDATPKILEAAEELAGYLKKVGGAETKIIEGLPNPIPENAIWVGFQPKLKDLFPQIDFDFKHPEEILIATDGKHMVIAGRDVWIPGHLEVLNSKGKKVLGKQLEYGTANAVYTFIQEKLDVRWLWPGQLGEDIIKKDRIAFAPFEYRYHPQIRGRGGFFNYSQFGSPDGPGYGRSGEWSRRQRLQLSSLAPSGGHGFGNWFDRFHKDHPEYFALQPDGSRSGYPGGHYAKICMSNPAVWEQWLSDVEKRIKEDPTQISFNASPNDGYTSGHCICEKCKEWDNPNGELRLFNWQGMSQEYVAMSDRDVTLANILAKKLKERFPDKDYYVEMLSYGNSRPAPVAAVPDDNVIILNVANMFWDVNSKDPNSLTGKTNAQQYAEWGKIAKMQVWRPNTGNPAGWQQGLPDVHLSRFAESFRLAAKGNCVGVFVDMIWEHWGTQGPLYYLIGQMAWNPYVDTKAVMEDYYRRGFGTASEEIREYWELLENTRNKKVDEEKSFVEAYDKDFFDRAYALIKKAEEKSRTADEKYRKRIEFVKLGLDYTRLITDCRVMIERIQKTDGADKEADAIARKNWEQIKKLCDENPLVVNWGPIRPNGRRMSGTHPDNMVTSKKTGTKKIQTEVKKASSTELDAISSGWELVFQDDFERNELGKGWIPINGEWTVKDGYLRGSGTIISDEVMPNGVVGYQRMEFDAISDVKPLVLFKDKPASKVTPGDMSSFIHVQSPDKAKDPVKSGYFFQFGGRNNTVNQILKLSSNIGEGDASKKCIISDKVHKVIVENDNGRIRLIVDGEILIEAEDKKPIVGSDFDRVGFYFHTASKINNVKVYIKRLANDLDTDL